MNEEQYNELFAKLNDPDFETNFNLKHNLSNILEIIKVGEGLMSETKLVEIKTAENPIYIVGDIHGYFNDLLRLHKIITDEVSGDKTWQLVFLGDYIDFGKYSCYVLLYIILLKILRPENVHILRGNHETRQPEESGSKSFVSYFGAVI